MRKFLLILLIVLLAVGALAACAPIEHIGAEVGDYARALPTWAIVVGAIVLFFIGFSIIWKLIPGFVKVIALIALAVAIAGVAYGLWTIPGIDKQMIDDAGNAIEDLLPESSASPSGDEPVNE
jgi:membrane protease YdiL (CAAX protease family)